MRPLNLKLKGFTAFRDEQEIDFTDLDLFVLWGPTGSGKSSLLDAITYALYGYVERVGNQVSQLVSHGQPRLSVTLEFAIGDKAYRVTRSTSVKGGSKALLESREGDDWQSYEEGADQVREVNRMIADLIGLDYEAFTRSVILPQGRFAEFLNGDAAKRREILTELLGLELFKQMSQRANEIAKNAKVNLDNKTDLLQREYAGVSDEALAVARKQHESLTDAVTAVEMLEKKLTGIEKRFTTAESARKAIANCTAEVRDAADTFGEVAAGLDSVAKEAAGAHATVKQAGTEVKQTERIHGQAAKKRVTSEGKAGSLEDLAGLRSKAELIAALREDQTATAEDIGRAEQIAVEVSDAAKAAATELTHAKKTTEKAAAGVVAAETAHSAAHKRDVIGGLVIDLKPGDPCPVCDRPLNSMPKAAKKEIQAAKKALDDARGAEKKAAAALTRAETAHAVALQKQQTARDDIVRRKKEAQAEKARLDRLTAEVAAVAGKSTNPLAQLDKQIETLRELIDAERAAEKALGDSRAELSRRELAVSKLESEVDKLRARMTGIPLAPMCARAHDAAPDLGVIELSMHDLPAEIEQIAAVASETAKELVKLADGLDALHSTRERELAELLVEAQDALPGGVSLDTKTLTAMVAEARATAGRLKADVAVQAKAVADMTDSLEKKALYERELEGHRNEHRVYLALGRELRGDSIVQFLQAEALEVLAQAASIHLQELSSTRYKLVYEDDKFYVVDAWNGDERRNVKTLSGGETFLASLALALALSEQVQLLAVVERSRLESLFLDEGFGTLDAETLDVIAPAIAQLGDSGRVVGVITHVEELADRLPVKLRVVKSPRGSTLSFEDPAGISL